MKTIVTIAAMTAMSVLGMAQTPNDFRSFSWGASLSQVQAGEKSKLIGSEDKNDLLIFEDQIAEADCDVIYQFNDNNKLIGGTYSFLKSYPNPQLYMQDFNRLRDLLIEKYGKPKMEKEAWSNNTPVSEKDNFGQAIMDGYLTISAIWNTDRSVIKVSLTAKEKRPIVQIHYTAKSLSELENKEELKKALSKL